MCVLHYPSGMLGILSGMLGIEPVRLPEVGYADTSHTTMQLISKEDVDSVLDLIMTMLDSRGDAFLQKGSLTIGIFPQPCSLFDAPAYCASLGIQVIVVSSAGSIRLQG